MTQRKFSLPVTAMIVVSILLAVSFGLAERLEVAVDVTTLSPETAAQILEEIHGDIDSVKAVNDKTKTTVRLDIRGKFEGGGTYLRNCASDNFFVRPYAFPFAAIVLVLPSGGKFPGGDQAREQAARCLEKGVPTIRGMLPSGNRTKIKQQGKDVAHLYLYKYKDPGDVSLQLPKKIGND